MLTASCSSQSNLYISAMESSQSMHPQAMGQSSFLYYNPEPSAEHRQHGHFSPHPNTVQEHQYQQHMYYQEMMMQRQQQHMMYPRLPSSGPQMYTPQPKPLLSMASPRPLQQKPAFLCQYEGQQLSLDTECSTPDVYVYPSTPPLSFSGSATSSPPSSCRVLPTPVTGMYLGLDNIEGVKEGCEGDVQSEILAGGDWTRRCSSPLTPGMSVDEINPEIAKESCVNFTLIKLICDGWIRSKCPLANNCGVRSIHSPAFSNGQPSLRPPFHQLLPFTLSLTITRATLCYFRHRLRFLRSSQPSCRYPKHEPRYDNSRLSVFADFMFRGQRGAQANAGR